MRGVRRYVGRRMHRDTGVRDQQADLRWYLEEYMDLPDYGSQVRARRIEQEIHGWIEKPFTLDQLGECIASADRPAPPGPPVT